MKKKNLLFRGLLLLLVWVILSIGLYFTIINAGAEFIPGDLF
jgi:hypothetical protein